MPDKGEERWKFLQPSVNGSVEESLKDPELHQPSFPLSVMEVSIMPSPQLSFKDAFICARSHFQHSNSERALGPLTSWCL